VSHVWTRTPATIADMDIILTTEFACLDLSINAWIATSNSTAIFVRLAHTCKMAVVDHVLVAVLLAIVLPVAVNVEAGIISRIVLAPCVLRNVHSATVFTIVLSGMQTLMED